jgi:hypothetical protein
MTDDEKLAAILAAIQIDPGNRGLARDPHDNLFTATAGDFAAACRSIVHDREPAVAAITGFFIPSATPAAFETDGPLGVVFLGRALAPLHIPLRFAAEPPVSNAIKAVIGSAGTPSGEAGAIRKVSHELWIERAGPAKDGRKYTMRGRDVTDYHHLEIRQVVVSQLRSPGSIGIGDGGNEIGMGKIPHETIVKNIPNGDLIHCRVPTDHLIVAGVSNWGAYALAAGVYVLRGAKPPADLFDPDREREILEVMVREGPLVDGVTGKQTATVDGLTWDEYVKPLVRIREILEA